MNLTWLSVVTREWLDFIAERRESGVCRAAVFWTLSPLTHHKAGVLHARRACSASTHERVWSAVCLPCNDYRVSPPLTSLTALRASYTREVVSAQRHDDETCESAEQLGD
jgi:hypothetical protein